MICEDLNPKGYKMRLLCVFSGRHNHEQWKAQELAEVKSRALRIAEELEKDIQWSERIWQYKMDNLEHYHIHLCLA